MPDNIEMQDLSNGKNSTPKDSLSKRNYQKFPFFVGNLPLLKIDLNPEIFLLKKVKITSLTLNLDILKSIHNHIFEANFFYKNLLESNFYINKKFTHRKPRVINTSLRELCAQHIAKEIVSNFKEYEDKYHPLAEEKDLPIINHTKMLALPTELIESIYEILCKDHVPIAEKLEAFFIETLRSRGVTPDQLKKLHS